MLPKKNRLVGRLNFQRVYRRGKKVSIGPVTVFALPAPELKVAFVVPKLVGKAVDRNRIRRRLSEAFRLKKRLYGSYHVIFKVNKDSLPDDFNQLQEMMQEISRRIDGKDSDSTH